MTDPLPERQQHNHATIRDYLITLRRRKWAILGIVVAAAVVAGAISLSQSKQYTAQATLQALDPAQSAGYAGVQQADVSVATVTSAQLAQSVTRDQVVAVVKRRLGLHETLDQIRSNLAVSEDAQSNYVLLNASAGTPAAATKLANAAARAVTDIENARIRAQFAVVARQESTKAASLLAEFAGRPNLQPADRARRQVASSEANTLAGIAARVEAFSKVVTIASIQADATPPSSPSSPHPVSTIILGGVLGLVLGLLLAWFLESLDRRLRRPDDVEAVLGLPVIGALPKGALGKVPGSSRDAVSLSTFRSVSTNLRLLASDNDPRPRSILVTSGLAEEGKTSVALGLALSAAASGTRTLLIEADVYRPVHAERLGLSPAPGLADYLGAEASPDEILQVYTFVDPAIEQALEGRAPNGSASRLACITAGNAKLVRSSELVSDKCKAMIAEVSKAYELVVIDTAPLLAVPETLEMIEFVDAALFCARLGRTTTEEARDARTAFTRLRKRPLALVLTDLDRGTTGGYRYAYDHSSSPAPVQATS